MKVAVIAILLCASIPAAPCSGFPSPADYDVYRGSVSFRNFGDHKIGVAVIDENGRAGGYVHLFRFWIETPVVPISVNATTASVEYRGRELVILIPEKQLFYTFVLSDAQFGAPAPPGGFTAIRYVGYGLNHEVRPVASKGKSGHVSTTIDMCQDGAVDCFLNEDPGDGSGSGGGASCDNGGPGANACSVNSNTYGGCSVGCGSGYYACCNGGSITSYAHCYCVHQ